MENLCPVNQLLGKLLSQRGADIVQVFLFAGVGQPYGNEDQLLPVLKGKAPQGFLKAKDTAGVKAAQIDDHASA